MTRGQASAGRVGLSSLALVTLGLVTAPCAASPSSDELVREARAHEAAHDEDLAARRYMEALEVDPTSADAWMGLGALRAALGERDEAERVYSAALNRLPSLRRALVERARVRWALGRHRDAEADLDAYATVEDSDAALRELAGWYGADGHTPAQLATWRRLLAWARQRGDAASEAEARRMVRALVVLVGGADPAAVPPGPDATRRALAAIARRGG